MTERLNLNLNSTIFFTEWSKLSKMIRAEAVRPLEVKTRNHLALLLHPLGESKSEDPSTFRECRNEFQLSVISYKEFGATLHPL